MAGPYPTKPHLDLKAVTILLFLCFLWGGNMAAIKFSIRGVEPIFAAGLRSLIAAGLMLLWMRYQREALFPRSFKKIHALVVGFLFGVEFCFIYLAMRFTLAGRAYVFLYTAPFWVALGAHLLLTGDRLTWRRLGGLSVAFLGLVIVFSEGLFHYSTQVLFGDFLMILAALGWAATTVYIKRYFTQECTPFQTLLYQLLFSAPILFLLSVFLEKDPIRLIDLTVFLSLFYQTVIVAFLSYWAWFYLIHIYPVTTLSAFSFFTPIFGVFLSSLLLKEPLSLWLLIALGLVSLGIYWVNKR
ncbi:MAG: DMT family transporter [Deltaproteobacteria bacterium]|nr:DMT family transporter [Deltaproteobacteria bacterium]